MALNVIYEDCRCDICLQVDDCEICGSCRTLYCRKCAGYTYMCVLCSEDEDEEYLYQAWLEDSLYYDENELDEGR